MSVQNGDWQTSLTTGSTDAGITHDVIKMVHWNSSGCLLWTLFISPRLTPLIGTTIVLSEPRASWRQLLIVAVELKYLKPLLPRPW